MWKEDNNALVTELKFADFQQAMRFMQACIADIDKLNHHPEWCNVYSTVNIRLTTHDAGNTITEKDRKLAEVIEKIYKKFS